LPLREGTYYETLSAPAALAGGSLGGSGLGLQGGSIGGGGLGAQGGSVGGGGGALSGQGSGLGGGLDIDNIASDGTDFFTELSYLLGIGSGGGSPPAIDLNGGSGGSPTAN
jgi:hypothetical protein